MANDKTRRTYPSPRPWRLEGRQILSGKSRVVCELGVPGCVFSKVDAACGELIVVAANGHSDVIRSIGEVIREIGRMKKSADPVLWEELSNLQDGLKQTLWLAGGK